MEHVAMVRYDAMRQAIQACHTIDEVRSIKDKARALAAYREIAQNPEPRRQVQEIIARAERQMGHMLKDMAEKGERKKGNSSKVKSEASTLQTLGLTKDESSRCQQLAAIPEKDFEEYMAGAEMPTSTGAIDYYVKGAKRSEPDPQQKLRNRLCSELLDLNMGRVMVRQSQEKGADLRYDCEVVFHCIPILSIEKLIKTLKEKK